MFKKSNKEPQLNMFSSPSSLLTGKSLKMYDDKTAWHNKFRQQVTSKIDEDIFKPLYCSDNGTPNAPIRVLVAMMILKEAEGISDHKLFENCRFNMLTRNAIGLVNADDSLPTESTYYLFRKRVVDYAKANGVNLFEVVFQQVTKNQCAEFEVSGKAIRMDSKLLGSNIAWLSRYELIHETFRLFYSEVKQTGKLDKATAEVLESLLALEGNKITYTCSNEEVQTRLQQLGAVIYKILPLFSIADAPRYYQTLARVFDEQYSIDENKIVTARAKEEITAQSVQSPHDTDCTYRNKGGDTVKGYSINVTESCDDGDVLNLIGHVDVREASTPDVDYLKDDIKKVEEVFTSKVETAHADGAYHSKDNQAFCKEDGRNIELYLHAIQGEAGRYNLDLVDNKLLVLDTLTNQHVAYTQVIDKKGIVKWRIDLHKGYRYFSQDELNTCLIRKKIAATPIETLRKRNNVEATIFQLAYHYPNSKSRYRGLIKHQMWANIRCLWVNFVRLLNFIGKVRPIPTFSIKNTFSPLCRSWASVIKKFLVIIFPNLKGAILKKLIFATFKN
ncbi:MAG TPA: transposase [Ohtaekwangia sp.]|nr:transposase [Ohtaekwangia sp.]